MRTAIITGSVIDHGGIIHDDCSVDICVVDNRTIYVDDGCIIPERISFPSATIKTRSTVTISIIHTTIKSDMRSPIPMVEPIMATGIFPIRRSP
jgi:hypothetical protein